jgi:hypothetical protein
MQRHYKMRIYLLGGHALSKNSEKVAESQKSRGGKLLNRHIVHRQICGVWNELSQIFSLKKKVNKEKNQRAVGIGLSSSDTDWKTS